MSEYSSVNTTVRSCMAGQKSARPWAGALGGAAARRTRVPTARAAIRPVMVRLLMFFSLLLEHARRPEGLERQFLDLVVVDVDDGADAVAGAFVDLPLQHAGEEPAEKSEEHVGAINVAGAAVRIAEG